MADDAKFLLLPLLLLLACGASALDRPRAPRSRTANSDAQWLDQPLDHFSNTTTTTFRQRWYEVLTHWRAPDGPLILALGGEGPQDTPYGVGDEAEAVARRTGAAVLTLEHRFFGQSLPFAEHTVRNLKYLTVEQELEDLAHFLRWYHAHKGWAARRKTLVLGGSYAGMVAANMRYAHPELVDAAWSSSGVVDAVLNFTAFDLQVAVSLGPVCAELVRRAGEQVEALLRTDNAAAKRLFGAEGMSDDDLLWMLSDASTIPPQYGRASELCTPMAAANDAGESLAVALAAFCNSTFYPKYCAGAGPYLYSDELMRKTAADQDWSAQRAWWWMVCNQLAYAQAYPGELGVRSARIDLAFHKRKCDAVYGPGVWPPDTAAFNAKYGGSHPKATNVFFINASGDPWQWAGVRRTLSKSQQAYLMVGPDVGHCRDLHGPTSTDPVDVKAARLAGEEFVAPLLQ